MAHLPALVVVVVVMVVGFGTLLGLRAWRRRQRRLAFEAHDLPVLPRARMRSQVIDVATGEILANEAEMAAMAARHAAPTRELVADTEELARLSMRATATRELSIHQRPTRELCVESANEVARHLQARSRSRRDEEPTLKVITSEVQSYRDSTAEELLRMLGPSPTPSLRNIEIYYRLGLVHLASKQDAMARRCFLTVEEVSPGYRDVARHLAQLPAHIPTMSGPSPAYHAFERHEVAAASVGGGLGRREGRRRSRD